MSLKVEDVVSGYTREVPILKGIDLVARDGLVTVIIGPNGAGKSTLLRTIYGYLQPTGATCSTMAARSRACRPSGCSAKALPICSRATACFQG